MKEDHGFHCDINNYNEAFSLVKKKKREFVTYTKNMIWLVDI